MARILRSYGISKANDFMWKGVLYYGFVPPEPPAAVTSLPYLQMGKFLSPLPAG